MKEVEKEFEEIAGQEFEDTRFERCLFISTDARKAKFVDCDFIGCTISSMKLDGAVLQATFQNCKIEGINFFTAKREVLSVSFEDCLIRFCSFAELKLKEVRLVRCDLRQVDFADADLTQAQFEGSSFEDCTFRQTNLTRADFRTARGYSIDPRHNRIKGGRFDVPEVLGLLDSFEVEIG